MVPSGRQGSLQHVFEEIIIGDGPAEVEPGFSDLTEVLQESVLPCTNVAW
jgi:hypothetical protein